jgi:hypothetical protein
VIATAVVVVAALVALAYVVLPLLRGTGGAVDHGEPSEADEAAARKGTALGAIVDLEADHAMGKLTDDDFEALRRRYEAEALEALRAVDEHREPAGDALEREIATVRRRLECPACGAPRRPGAACARCGESPSPPAPSTRSE